MIKLFTHTDLDGVGCAVLAKLAFSENVDIEYCNYDDVNQKVEEYFNSDSSDDECHITDLSVNDELAYKINNSGKMYGLFDHHATALELNKYDWCGVIVEDKETGVKTSGTELYYHWLVFSGYLEKDDTLDKFVETVRNYDTWRWSTLAEDGVVCKQVNDLLYIYGRDKFIDWCFERLNTNGFPMFTDTDKTILEIKQNEIDTYIEEKSEHLFIADFCGKVCGFVFADKYFSELGNKLCEKYPEFDFVAIINMDGTISYRTVKDDIDLGNDVAKLFGGGGHPKAAGSQISNEIRMEVVRKIFER